MSDPSRLTTSVYDLFEGDDDDDDVYEPATEQSTLASTQDETETEAYTGRFYAELLE